MNKDKTTLQNGGIGFIGLLTIVFIVLKLTKVIAWSWWLVLSPIWIMAIVYVFIITVFLLAVIIKAFRQD